MICFVTGCGTGLEFPKLAEGQSRMTQVTDKMQIRSSGMSCDVCSQATLDGISLKNGFS